MEREMIEIQETKLKTLQELQRWLYRTSTTRGCCGWGQLDKDKFHSAVLGLKAAIHSAKSTGVDSGRVEFAERELSAACSRIDAVQARRVGFSISDCKAVGHVDGLREAGYTLKEVKRVGYTCKQARAAGWEDLEDLRLIGYTATEAKAAGWTSIVDIKAAGYVAGLKEAGWTRVAIKYANYTCAEAIVGGYAEELAAAGYTSTEAREAGCGPTETRAAGYTCGEARAAGWTSGEVKSGGYSCGDSREGGYSLREAIDAGWSLQELKDGGYVEGLRAAGFSSTEIRAVGLG
jgi:intracellular multiplication protein IcmE